jgi:hypothetical protein
MPYIITSPLETQSKRNDETSNKNGVQSLAENNSLNSGAKRKASFEDGDPPFVKRPRAEDLVEVNHSAKRKLDFRDGEDDEPAVKKLRGEEFGEQGGHAEADYELRGANHVLGKRWIMDLPILSDREFRQALHPNDTLKRRRQDEHLGVKRPRMDTFEDHLRDGNKLHGDYQGVNDHSANPPWLSPNAKRKLAGFVGEPTAKRRRQNEMPSSSPHQTVAGLFSLLEQFSNEEKNSRLEAYPKLREMSFHDFLRYIEKLNPMTPEFVLSIMDAPEEHRIHVMKGEREKSQVDYHTLLMAIRVIQQYPLQFGSPHKSQYLSPYLAEHYDDTHQTWTSIKRHCSICRSILESGTTAIEATDSSFITHEKCVDQFSHVLLDRMERIRNGQQ